MISYITQKTSATLRTSMLGILKQQVLTVPIATIGSRAVHKVCDRQPVTSVTLNSSMLNAQVMVDY